MMPPRLFLFVSAVSLLCVATGCSSTPSQSAASASAAKRTSYVTSGYGTVVRDGSGKCVRSGSWRAEDVTRECEPDMFARADAAAAEAEAERKAKEEAEQRAKAEADAAEQRAQAEAEAAAAAAAAAAKAEPTWQSVGADAYFETNKAELNDQARRALDALVERARDAEQLRITIVGHADSRGSPDLNRALSKQRADAVRAYLVEQGLPDVAMDIDARGEDDPVVNCDARPGTERGECLQVNRRSEIELSVLEPEA